MAVKRHKNEQFLVTVAKRSRAEIINEINSAILYFVILGPHFKIMQLSINIIYLNINRLTYLNIDRW